MTIPPCPLLPAVDRRLGFDRTRRHGNRRGEAWYLDTLVLAQELWLLGKPAQAILQLNKAWSADLRPEAPVLGLHPPPYAALGWILARSSGISGGFLGDPVRHFQHLASRMSGPRSEVRMWRAWCCHHVAARILGGAASRDGRQIAREGLWIPGPGLSLARLAALGWPGEAGHARREMGR